MKTSSTSTRQARHRGARAHLRRWSAAGATACLAFGTMIFGVTAPTSPASALGTGTCTFNGQPGLALDEGAIPSLSNVLSGVTDGMSVDVECTGLDPSALATVAVESSPVAGVVVPSSDVEDEADATGVKALATTSCSSAPDCANFTIPNPYTASDPNAVCPPTQAQINAGLGACILAVASIYSVGPPIVEGEVSAIVLEYGDTLPAPADPTLAFGQSTVQAGGSVSASDVASPTGYWWGAYPGTTGSIPASQILVDGIPATSSSVSVSPAVNNCVIDSIDDCSGSGTGGVLVPQALSGSFTVPSSVPSGTQTVEMFEAISTPEPGNSTNSEFPASGYLEATATINVTQLPPCTFNGNAASAGVSGVTPGASIAVSCSNLNTGDSYTLTEESPLAQVIAPTSAAAQVEDTTDAMPSGALGGTTWSPTYVTLSTPAIGSDPNSDCPPTQAQIDAGLVDCTLNLVDDGPTGSTVYAGVPIQYAGQGSPAPPTLAVSPSTAGPGTSVQVSDASGATTWWWGNAASTTTIAKADVLVGGVAAASSTVEVQAADYTAGGGTGTLTPPKLSGAFVAPKGTPGGAQTVAIYEANATAAVGNSTNPSFANFVAGSASISLGTPGYWLVAWDGGIFSYGGTAFFGSCPQIKGGCPGTVVGMAPTADGQGYWLADTHGDIYSFGDATYDGSIPGLGVKVRDIVSIVATPDGGGYWLLGRDGGVFTFGDAAFFGSCPQFPQGCPSHAVKLVPTPDGQGYWVVDVHGDVYSFGDATYEGSVPGLGKHVDDIVSMAHTPDGQGYWVVGSTGSVFTFGDAPFDGACGTLSTRRCGSFVTGIAPTSDGAGYWLTDSRGDVYTFGDAPYDGSVTGKRLAAPVIGIVAG